MPGIVNPSSRRPKFLRPEALTYLFHSAFAGAQVFFANFAEIAIVLDADWRTVSEPGSRSSLRPVLLKHLLGDWIFRMVRGSGLLVRSRHYRFTAVA